MQTVLVIDDSSATCDLIEKVLSPLGVQIITAGDGETGIDVARRAQPDVVVMNTRLPGMSGFEIAEMMKSDGELSSIPIIVLTATIMSREKFNRLGSFDGYVAKPFNPRELRECVERFLNNQ